MSRDGMNRFHRDDEEARDLEVAALLEWVDPASADPNYWLRFQSWVLKGAAPELARRRLMTNLTVGDVLVGWSRAVIPPAVAAAAIAAFILTHPLQTGGELASAASVEELLVAGMGYEPIPATLVNEEAASTVAFAEETF